MTSELYPQDCLLERRKRLRRSTHVFGLDFVEVCARRDANSLRRKLRLHLLGQRPTWLKTADHVVLTDCRNEHRVPIAIVPPQGKPNYGNVLEFEVLESVCDDVDYSITIDMSQHPAPILDPFFACATFQFNTHLPAKIDCVSSPAAEPPPPITPDINYLAKDYATFRQLMLDRLAVTMPEWQEQCPADIGVMLVEILAYAADHLSYYQDAVATEAYLGTARLRQSLRRHARLVDYRVHEGCNARTWVQLQVEESQKWIDLEPRDLFFVSAPRVPESRSSSTISKDQLDRLVRKMAHCEVFESVVSKPFRFWSSHNECTLHDWGGAEPCLPRGATSVYLVNHPPIVPGMAPTTVVPSSSSHRSSRPDGVDWLQFQRGDVLIFEELLGPWTGNSADADLAHRHVVRVTQVDYQHADDLYEHEGKLYRLPLVKISWDTADAIPFPLWISPPPDADWSSPPQAVSIARGNMLLTDHGRREQCAIELRPSWDTSLDEPNKNYPRASIHAKLAAPNLTFSDGLAPSQSPASVQLRQDPRRATPHVMLQPSQQARPFEEQFSFLELRDLRRIAKRLLAQIVDRLSSGTVVPSSLPRANRFAMQVHHACGHDADSRSLETFQGLSKIRDAIKDDMGTVWLPEYDLIECGPDDPRFVVEMSDDRKAQLRFGQRGFGRTPDLNDNPWVADYRIGNGTTGNVPAESIGLAGSYTGNLPAIRSVRNPMPAVGGVDPETPQEVRLFAPHAIHANLRRAITPEDYETITMREFGKVLQRAKGSFRWTGHETQVLVAVDPIGRERASSKLLESIRATLQRFRRIGHSVVVRNAVRVVPALGLTVCVNAHVIREQIQNELDQLFSDQVLPNGTLAFFHPDQLTFGEGIYVSQIVAAATRTLGDRIVHIEVTQLHRRDEGPAYELENGVLALRSQEIVRFDNNANHPEFGILEYKIKGGR